MDIYFWGLMLLPFAVAIVACEWDNVAAGLMSLFIVSLIVWFKLDINPLQWAMEHWLTVIYYTAGYVVAGAVYSILKWIWVVNHSGEKIKTAYENFRTMASKGPNSKPPTIEDFKHSDYNPLRASRNKSKIMIWLVWWPASLFWTFAHDFLVEIWNHVYNLFVNLYDKIANSKIDKTLS
jgi:hypothetical protein